MATHTEFEKSFFRENMRLPTAAEIERGSLVARADSVAPKLVMTEVLDDAGRKHRTFKYDTPGAFKTWMLPYMAEAQRQLFINNNAKPKDQCEARAARMLADERATAQQISKHGVESIVASFEV